jgi:hypothetical protein
MKRVLWAVLLGASACVSLSCDRVLGIPERTLDARLSCADGECVCLPNFGDCDDNLDNGCESDTRSSSANCGACGHDCLGGGCVDGRCQPVVVSTLEGVASFGMIDGIIHAVAITADLNNVLRRVDVRQPVPVPLGPPPLQNKIIFEGGDIRTGTNALIQYDYNVVHTVSLETGAVTQLFKGLEGNVASCAGAGGMVWWIYHDYSTGESLLYRAPEHGSAAVADPSIYPHWELPVFVDEQGAYIWDPTTSVLMRYPPEGGPGVPMLNMPENTGGLVVTSDAKNLYMNTFGNVTSTLFAVPRGGGAPRNLAQIGVGVMVGVADASHIYLQNAGSGSVSRVPIEGGDEEVIATGQYLQSNKPLFLDERAVYWLAGEAVWRLAK